MLSLQPCPILCNPINCSPPGSSVYGTIPARILKWLPFPPSGDLPDPGIKPLSPAALALEGGFSTSEPPGKCQSFSIPLLKTLSWKFSLNPPGLGLCEGRSPLCPSLPGKPIKLFFSTSLKTLFLKFGLALVNRDWDFGVSYPVIQPPSLGAV